MFVTTRDAARRLTELLAAPIELAWVEDLAESGILPTYPAGEDRVVLWNDVVELVFVVQHLPDHRGASYVGRDLFSRGRPSSFDLHRDTRVNLAQRTSPVDPGVNAALRNLVDFVNRSRPDGGRGDLRVPYLSGSEVFTTSPTIAEFADLQVKRDLDLKSLQASRFAGTAHYMGSKRALGAFLVHGLCGVLPDNGIVLDIMCGSGAAAAAFSRVWDTRVSDAQLFCQILATVQGGGFSVRRAEKLLEKLLPATRKHASDLQERLRGLLEQEDQLLHGDLGEDLLRQYRTFIEGVPTYPNEGTFGDWDPTNEVRSRKNDAKREPYCLFTCYFANVFFGLRQCVEIDSVRFAIDSLDDEDERRWALGALIAAVSDRSTTYGGHFAQPKYRTASEITQKSLGRVVEGRTASIVHEFSIRLLNLARASESAPRPITTTPGPWLAALTSWKGDVRGRPALVYLDAPYKREEYSRYYHVLETLVSYDYPGCVGCGKTPDRRLGERFQSEFFTRTKSSIEGILVNVIAQVLSCGFACAWSYSDNGDANIVTVVNDVGTRIRCRVRSLSTLYEHKPQGGRRAKTVTEYLLVFTPENWC